MRTQERKSAGMKWRTAAALFFVFTLTAGVYGQNGAWPSNASARARAEAETLEPDLRPLLRAGRLDDLR